MHSDPFDLMRGDDGYRIEQVEIAQQVLALHVGMYQQGCLTTFVTETGVTRSGADAAPELFSWQEPTFADQGECDRLRHLLEALTRFLNTGGAWSEIDRAVARLRQFAFGPLVFEGYTFRESSINSVGDWEHVFLADTPRKDGRDIVVWYEGSFIDRCTTEEYRQIKFDIQNEDDDDQEEEDDQEEDDQEEDNDGCGEE